MADNKTTMDELNELINNFDEHYYKKQIQKYGHRVSWILPQSYDDSLTYLEMLQSLLYTLNAEIKRAITAEKILGVDLDNEIARAKAAEQALREALDAEIARAKAEEERLDNKIDTETQRAKDAEKVLTDNLNTEIQRAKDAEQTLTNNLNSEIARAKQAEADLRTALDTETARAKEAEQANKTAIENEVATRKAGETHIATFTSSRSVPAGTQLGDTFTVSLSNVQAITGGTPVVGYVTGTVKYNDVNLPVLEWSWSNTDGNISISALVKMNQEKVDNVNTLAIHGNFTYKTSE